MKCTRVIKTPNDHSNKLYLTFDDGPSPECTAAVLEVLNRLNVEATFFTIANTATKNVSIFNEIIAEGHSVGNHSLDHNYRHFFTSKESIKNWIVQSENILSEMLGHPTVGFRSPAGIQTPPLHWALNKLNMPLIHWNTRFYDTSFPWHKKKAMSSLTKTTAGSIILLHDTHTESYKDTFLETLQVYITEAKQSGFIFAPIPMKDKAS